MTDQQSSWTLGCYGGEIETPNIDRLAREGIRLTNFFTNSACCTPSRGCFFTGLYPHAHGAYFNDLPLRRDAKTIAHILHDTAYRTSYIGKWHLDGDWNTFGEAYRLAGADPENVLLPQKEKMAGQRDRWIGGDRSMGFDNCQWMFNCSHAKRVARAADAVRLINGEPGDEESYTTDWLTTKAIEIIESAGDTPHFITLAIPDPHDPFTVRAPFDTMFDPRSVRVPETFSEKNLPDWLESETAQRWSRPENVVGSEQVLRKAKAQYLGEVACIDLNVGRIISALEQEGILDETIIVFTTDHGEYMGEHGIYAKNQLYEGAYRIPFIIRYPPGVRAGTTLEGFVTTVDVQQTLLGLMDVSAGGDEQGRDASLLIRGESIPWEDEAFIYGTMADRAGVFTPEYELAYAKNSKDHILFDRIHDTSQVRNLFFDPDYSHVVEELTQRLVSHNQAIGAPESIWLGT